MGGRKSEDTRRSGPLIIVGVGDRGYGTSTIKPNRKGFGIPFIIPDLGKGKRSKGESEEDEDKSRSPGKGGRQSIGKRPVSGQGSRVGLPIIAGSFDGGRRTTEKEESKDDEGMRRLGGVAVVGDGRWGGLNSTIGEFGPEGRGPSGGTLQFIALKIFFILLF